MIGICHNLLMCGRYRLSRRRQLVEEYLVTVLGASKRTKQPRSLRVEEFQRFVKHLSEPFRTMAFLCCCLGLRISE